MVAYGAYAHPGVHIILHYRQPLSKTTYAHSHRAHMNEVILANLVVKMTSVMLGRRMKCTAAKSSVEAADSTEARHEAA